MTRKDPSARTSKPPKRGEVIDLLAQAGRALHLHEIASQLGIEPTYVNALDRVLDDLVFDGSVRAMPGRRFRASGEDTKRGNRRGGGGKDVEGFFHAHPRGFGFISQEGEGTDIFVPAESNAGAMHGDRVRGRVVATSARGSEGVVEEVLERKAKRTSGTLRKRGKSAWIEPDDQRVRGPVVVTFAEDAKQAKEGETVVIEFTRYPDSANENAEGRVIEILGEAGTPKVEVRKALALRSIDESFDPDAVTEAESFGKEVDPSALEGRLDLTHLPLPTIDPSDARDHDDAIWAVRKPDGTYEVWVAIADVSHYVTQGGPLDASALDRSCSIYLPDRAIPMLPRALSSNLCSLLPNVIRLCMCMHATLDQEGTLLTVELAQAFMKSRAKLTYEGVANALGLSQEAPASEEAIAMRKDLEVLRDIAMTLRAKRMKRGALDFEQPEPKVSVDMETGMPINVSKRTRDPGVGKAYQIVEEFMLLANEAVAQYLTAANIPTVFRNHAVPDPTKIQRFFGLCDRLGVVYPEGVDEDPKVLGAFIKELKAHARGQILETLLIRSMKQAVYESKNIGHFGLASKAYLHFTSPIRRYPDILVHRGVKLALSQQKKAGDTVDLEELAGAAKQASERERRAMEVEREVVDIYRAIFMKNAIGKRFPAMVSAFVGSGLFAMIDDPFVDVLVRTESLGEDFGLDEDGLAMVARRSGERIELGSAMLIEIEDVNIARHTVYGRRIASDETRPTRAVRRSGRTETRGGEAPVSEGARGESSRGRSSRPATREERDRGKAHEGRGRGGKPSKGGKPGSSKPLRSDASGKAGKPAGKPKKGTAGKKRRK